MKNEIKLTMRKRIYTVRTLDWRPGQPLRKIPVPTRVEEWSPKTFDATPVVHTGSRS